MVTAVQNAFKRLHALLDGNEETASRSGSRSGRSQIDRGREAAYEKLIEDYFSDTPRYNDAHFRRRFRMRKDSCYEICC